MRLLAVAGLCNAYPRDFSHFLSALANAWQLTLRPRKAALRELPMDQLRNWTMNRVRVAASLPPISSAFLHRATWVGVWPVLLAAWLVVGAAMQPHADAITITMEYTDEGDPVPHDENPSWDADGMILKRHFDAAKAIWEALLPGPGNYEFDFHWDDDISGLGLTTDLGAFDVFVEINPTANWYIDPTPMDNKEFTVATAQTLYGELTGLQQSNYFPGTPPPNALEVGYWGTGIATFANTVGQPAVNASTGVDLLSTIVHEMGHVLGIGAEVGSEPGDYNILPQHVGGGVDVLVAEGDGGHLAGMGEVQFLMCENCGAVGRRRFPTATDVLVIAEDQGITDVNLQRVGRISSGLWSESNAWIGADVPNFPQDAYITHGATVTLDVNASVNDLRVANGSTLAVGEKALNLGGNLNIASGSTVSVGTGGTISANNIFRGSNDITTAAGSLVWFNSYSGGGGPTANFNGSIRIGNNGNTAPPTTFNPSTITTWTIAEELAIDSGNGNISMVIDGGANFTSASGRVGPANGVGLAPLVTIDGATASWDVDGPLAIPLGNVTVTNGGYLEANSATIGSTIGRSTVVVQVSGSLVHVSGNLEVGPAALVGDGQGNLTLRADASVGVDGNLNIHGTSTRTSEVSVQTNANLEVDGAINVGPYGLLTYRDLTFGYSGIIGSKTTNNLGGGDNPTGSQIGGITRFAGNSIANRNVAPGTSQFTNHPGTTVFGGAGSTEFRDSASAGSAAFHNLPGGTVSRYSGTTRFFDFATAANGQFFNQPGRWTIPPTVEFNGDSTGGNGTFVNLPGVLGVSQGGAFVFNDRAKAGTGTYATQGEAGYIEFNDFSSAENGTFTTVDAISSGNSRITFYDDSKAGTANFDMRAGSVLNFITRSSAEDATIRLRANSVAGFGGEYNVPYLPTVTAGTADIIVEGMNVAGRWGGHVGFSTWSTAGNAVINVHGGSVANAAGGTASFDYQGSAGQATLITHGGAAGAEGGQIYFRRGGNGPGATIINNTGGYVDFGGNISYEGTDIGSIQGGGTFALNGSELRTGSLNTSTTVTGPIIDAIGTNPNGKLTKVGTGTLTLAGANTHTGATTINGGAVNVAGSLAGAAVVNNGGTLLGSGSIGGTVTVNAGGVLAPGNSPGTLTIGGLTMNAGATLNFELGDPLRDHIVITGNGNVALAGLLNVSFIAGFIPTPGQSFPLFEGAIGASTGAFDDFNAPTVNGLTVDLVQNGASLLLQVGGATRPGDFNSDDSVDAADYVVWRKGLGTIYTQADYNIWRAHFGANTGAGASVNAPVPEPATLVLLLIGMAALRARRRLER
jgi:autotransporter-associated beta strand protein